MLEGRALAGSTYSLLVENAPDLHFAKPQIAYWQSAASPLLTISSFPQDILVAICSLERGIFLRDWQCYWNGLWVTLHRNALWFFWSFWKITPIGTMHIFNWFPDHLSYRSSCARTSHLVWMSSWKRADVGWPCSMWAFWSFWTLGLKRKYRNLW